MKVAWYNSVRFRLILLLSGVYMGAVVLMVSIPYRKWDKNWTEQKIDEITRYGNYIAADIAINELITGDLPFQDSVGEGEALSFSRFYSYVRVMVLDENAKVVEDSCRTKIGTHIINDDILQALSGKMARQQRENYVQISIPIMDYSETDVRGAVYLIFALDDLNINFSANRGTAVTTAFIIGLAIVILTAIICLQKTRKFDKILYWLEGIVHREQLVPEKKLQFPDEYGMIVKGVQDAMHEMVVLDQSRKEFVSNVSHELKTPLSSMKVLAESLLLQENVPPEIYREFLKDINDEVDRENGIVTDLLTLVRLEEKEKALNISHVSLNQMVEDILKRLKPLADQRGIELIMETSREVEIDLDETKMSIALSNLIENGIKYNKENGQVFVTVDSDHLNGKIIVEDTGIGIEEENYNNIFQRFYRVDKSRSRENGVGGSGLGLAIVRQIILLHNGTIGVKSVVGEGTMFMVSIPLRQIPQQDEELL